MIWKIELEQEILKEATSDWEAFLLSKEIYWQLNLSSKQISPADRRVRISAGRILISYFLLKHLNENDQDPILNNFLALKNKWLANWQKKVSEELPIRIRQWNQFVNDLRGDSDFSQPQMNNQLQLRLMIDLLMNESDEIVKEKLLPLIGNLDTRYKHLTVKNGFVWGSELIDIFPENEYWYLYRKSGKSEGR
jgi:hypothetical protein